MNAKEIENHFKRLLECMGMADGSLKLLANKECRKLIDSVSSLSNEKAEKESSLVDYNVRVNRLVDHLKYSEQDILQDLKLLDAYRSQLMTEVHMFKVSEHDQEALGKKIKEAAKNVEYHSEKIEFTQREIIKVQINIEALSDKMKWARSTLDEWRQVVDKGDETILLIEKYCKEDQNKANGLESKRRMTQEKIIKQKALLMDKYEEQKSLEHILDRTCELYRQAHQERLTMVDTWKEAVQTMNQRDEDIHRIDKSIEDAKKLKNILNGKLQEQDEFYNILVLNNKSKQYENDQLNDDMSKARDRQRALHDLLLVKQGELVTTEKLMKTYDGKLAQQRQINRHHLAERQKLEEQFISNRGRLDKINKKHQEILDKKMSGEYRLKELDELMAVEERFLKDIVKENGRLADKSYRSQELLCKLKEEENLILMSIAGTESQILGKKRSTENLMILTQKQHNLLYDTNFELTKVEGRFSKLTGNDQISTEMEQKVQKLEKLHNAKTIEYNMVQDQIEKVEDDMRKLTIAYGHDAEELRKLNTKLEKRRLECEGGEKILIKHTMENQERLVEQSIMKMRVHQLETMLRKEKEKIFSLEKHKMDLELTMNERILELNLARDLLIARRKNLWEERSQLRADVGDRTSKIAAMKARYENAKALLGMNMDGTPVTATQIKIENAQEKAILMKEGTDLNEKVIKAEKDIKAMENTLILINFSNQNFKKTVTEVDDDNPDIVELNDLNDKYCELVKELKESRDVLAAKIHELNSIQIHIKEVDLQLNELTRMRDEAHFTLEKLEKELSEQRAKLCRSEKDMKMQYKNAKLKITDSQYFKNFEKNLTVMELDQRNTSALQQLGDMVDTIIGMGPVITQYFNEKGIIVPTGTKKPRNTVRSDSDDMSSSTSTCQTITSKKSTRSSVGSIILLDFPHNATVTSTKSSHSISKSTSRMH